MQYPVVIQKAALVLLDAVLVYGTGFLAFEFRFDGSVPPYYIEQYKEIAPAYIALNLVAFYFAGMYSPVWRYISIDEAFIILKGVTLGQILFTVLVHLIPHVGWLTFLGIGRGFPRSIILLAWLLNAFTLGGLRLTPRLLRLLMQRARGTREALVKRRRRVLLVGAGEAGALVVREMLRHPKLGYNIRGFLDDDPRKRGRQVHGIPIIGTRQDLTGLITDQEIDEVVITMPSAPKQVINEVVSACQGHDVQVKILPGVFELLGRKSGVNIHHIREVAIEDLLGREVVHLNLTQIAEYLRGQRVMVTGAGGSIGSEICRQITGFEPEQLLLLDNNENGLFETSLSLSFLERTPKYELIVADIRDISRLSQVFDTYRPTVLFHAAAHKHVPLMEANPTEAIKTNVFGTLNLANLSLEVGLKKFVLISTDKAVNPTSIMGASKRLAEMISQMMQRRQSAGEKATHFVAVRFGNVLGSRGSVVPTFKEQIARGGPLTVTHPDMRRYFMTIPEATQLVIQAGAIGRGGEIFVLDMGEPVKILDLARKMISLSGFRPGEDIEILFTGPRPGEKLYEELSLAEEGMRPTAHPRIWVCKGNLSDVDKLEHGLALLQEAASLGNLERLEQLLHMLIPGFRVAMAPVAVTTERGMEE